MAMNGTSSTETEQIIIGISSSISIVCSFLILTTFACLREVQTLTRQIIICMTIADLLTALANLIGAMVIHGQFHTVSSKTVIEDDGFLSWCTIQSFVSSTSSLWSFLWTMVLSIALHYVIVKEKVDRIIKVLPWLHVLCWLLPLVVNVVALWKGKLGYSKDAVTGGWCWISTDVHNEAVIWMTLDGKFIEILTYFVIFYYFVLIKKHLKKKLRKISRSSASSLTKNSNSIVDAIRLLEKKLIFLPILLILLRIWGTIRYLFVVFKLNTANHKGVETADRVLSYLQGVGDSSQATLNFIIFCACTPKIRKQIFNWIHSGKCHQNSAAKTDSEEGERKTLITKP
ncbi:G-protein coupled receptor 157-like [Clytia hemisphaerica]|uniref:G-protein coupled receptor 157-like n=1 Tax=Clytia hemisphaerica TaxID=252671 RepID=UPI0034D42BE7|eukprot:TCONS_00052251-protein